MEEEIVKEICKKYNKREEHVCLLIKICKDNKVKNIRQVLEEVLDSSVSKVCQIK